ncbi:hypothetical protein P691DRAFT_764592 [Macrolepiota fuliginosa MF-IS2]|uniref:Uncharacterized protein n=1 Tax=Macrolepiota fuliginosa MF-IS2 TaxID=1400762 RepID=A0A9P5X489_9AGAR|nr:hypothetical protein P691DRAFT_764592 [Macrolepiota fuliginosa MF-IS2]
MFPAEILETILSCLKNDNAILALRSCALVSSDFLPIARTFLFGHVFLLPQPRQSATALSTRSYSLASRTDTQNPQPGLRSESLSPYVPSPRAAPSTQWDIEPEVHASNACFRLLRLLSTSPTLAHYIRRVSIIDGRLFPLADLPPSRGDSLLSALGLDNAQSEQYYTVRDKLNGLQWFLSTPPRVFYALVQKLDLQSFDLVFQEGPKVSWGRIPRDIRSALNYLFACPTLQTLELRGMSWETPSSLHDLIITLSQGSITNLTFRNVKLVSTLPTTSHIPRRGRSPTRRDPSPVPGSCDRSENRHPPHVDLRQNQFNSPPPGSSHAKPFSRQELNSNSRAQNQNQNCQMTLPPVNPLSSRALRLESLHIGPVPSDLAGVLQAPSTLDFLRVLVCDAHPGSGSIGKGDDRAASEQASPSLEPLKRLSIPSVDLDNISELFSILAHSGMTNVLEVLELNERLSFSTSVSIPSSTSTHARTTASSGQGIDFSSFTSLKHLRLGIHVAHQPLLHPGLVIAHPTLVPHACIQPHSTLHQNHTPSTLQWLTQILDTLPPNLTHLTISLSFDNQLLTAENNFRTPDSDWGILSDKLRSFQFRSTPFDGSRRVKVKLNIRVATTSLSSGLVSGPGFSPAAFGTPLTGPVPSRGRGRGRTRVSHSDFVGGCDGDLRNVEDGVGDTIAKRWIMESFGGLDVVFL